jgi:DNA-binding NarL/FixJ family response regulator
LAKEIKDKKREANICGNLAVSYCNKGDLETGISYYHSAISILESIDSPFISVAIVDDHKMVVESLSKLINESGIALVTDVYYNLKSCRSGLAKTLPDVLLLDIGLPDGDGVDFCAEITKNYPELKIIMLTTYKEFSIAKRALHNGALGYILKNAESEEMLAGIETVSKGEQFLCEEIDLLLKEKRYEDFVWLSNREKEILKYIADGHTTKGIVDLIYRDIETVRSCRKNLLIKLDAKNTAVMVKKGYEMKLIW